MFTRSGAVYDAIYGGIKDYAAEATAIAAKLRSVHPGPRTVLEAACGTGEHARLLATEHGFFVDGFDLNPEFAAIAQRKHPEGRFFAADMARFALRSRYDAITCLFSSIGYLRTLDRVREALVCFRQHLAPGGALLVEPWFSPGTLVDGHTVTQEGSGPDVHVVRTSRVEIDGRISRLHMDYMVHDPSGMHRFSEAHELGLFTPEEMLQCFERAGLTAEFDPDGLTGRGLYVARAASA